MKIEILNEEELSSVVGGGNSWDNFTRGVGKGFCTGPVGVLGGVGELFEAAKIASNNKGHGASTYVEEGTGKVVGGGTCCALIAACAYGCYQLARKKKFIK